MGKASIPTFWMSDKEAPVAPVTLGQVCPAQNVGAGKNLRWRESTEQ